MLDRAIRIVSIIIEELKAKLDITLSKKWYNKDKVADIQELLEFNERLLVSLLSPDVSKRYV